MKSIRITLAYGTDAAPPVLEAFFASEELEREVILGGQVVDAVETITSFVYGSREAYETMLDGRDDVLEYELTPANDGFFVYLRRELGAQGLSLLEALSRKTIVVVPPIEVRSNRTIVLTIVGHPTDLGAVLEGAPEGASIDVLRVYGGVATNSARLTDRQRQAIRAAWEAGYYDVPRRNGIETVAEELDCAVSTASEILRRAEMRLVEHALASAF